MCAGGGAFRGRPGDRPALRGRGERAGRHACELMGRAQCMCAGGGAVKGRPGHHPALIWCGGGAGRWELWQARMLAKVTGPMHLHRWRSCRSAPRRSSSAMRARWAHWPARMRACAQRRGCCLGRTPPRRSTRTWPRSAPTWVGFSCHALPRCLVRVRVRVRVATGLAVPWGWRPQRSSRAWPECALVITTE